MALFGSPATADAAGEATSEAERRKLLIVAVAGIALIAVAAFFLLPMILGGSSSSIAGSSSPLPRRAAAAPSMPSATPTPAFVLAPAAAYSDPFQPLPEEVAAEAAAAAAASPAPSVSPSSATGSEAPTTSTGTGSTATASGSDTTKAGVMLVSVSGDKATIEVDGQRSQVTKGSSFGTGNAYKLTALTTTSASVTHGSTAKTLLVGESQTF